MKRFLFLLLTGIAAATIMCCSNPSGSSSDDTAKNTPSTPPSPTTPNTPATTGSPSSPADPATSTDPTSPADPATPGTPNTPATPADPDTASVTPSAALSALSLSVGILTPAFSPDRLEYAATVDTSFPTITLTGTATDKQATLDANDGKAQNLVDGTNALNYTVLARDGVASRTYKITVTRAKDKKPPMVSAFTISSTKIDSYLGDTTITGSFTIEDPSGIKELGGLCFLPTGQSPDVKKNESLSTFTRAVYDWSLVIPKFGRKGSYSLKRESLYVSDTLNNNIWEPLFAAGCTTEFEVTSSASDTEGPTLTNFTVTQKTLSKASSDGIFTGSFTVEDPSGVQNITVLTFCYPDYTNDIGLNYAIVKKNTALSTKTVAVFDWRLDLSNIDPANSINAKKIVAILTPLDGVGNISTYKRIESSALELTQ